MNQKYTAGCILESREAFMKLVEDAKRDGVYRGHSHEIFGDTLVGTRWHERHVLRLTGGEEVTYFVKGRIDHDAEMNRFERSLDFSDIGGCD